MHMNDRMPQPSKAVPGVPPALEQIIMKATEKHQVNRFKNADEMLDALRNVDRLTGGFVDPAIAGAVRSSLTDDAVYADEGEYGVDGYDDGQDPGDADIYDEPEDDAYRDDEYYDREYDEDDEDDIRRAKAKKKKGKRPKRKDENKKYKVLAVVVAIAAALLLVIFVIKPYILDNPNLFNKADEVAKVDNVVGIAVEDATKLLEDNDYVVKLEDMYSDKYKAGIVAEQDPEADTELAKGETVTLYVSIGPEEEEQPEEEDTSVVEEDPMGEVPELMGKSRASAQYAIEAAGFKMGEPKLEDSEKPVDQVIAQNPKAGKQLKKGETIDITISLGPKAVEVNMPELIGLTDKQAKDALKKAGLIAGAADKEYSSDYPKDTVMWQQYKKGTKLSDGQTVDYKISRGPEEKTTTVPIDIDYSGAQADVFYLTVLLVPGDGSGEKVIVENRETIKANGGETVNVRGKGAGAQVIVYFDDVERVYNVDFNTGEVSG
jgi:serine/threonine-protein kinase